MRVGFVAETVISRLDDEYCTTHGSDHDKQAMLTWDAETKDVPNGYTLLIGKDCGKHFHHPTVSDQKTKLKLKMINVWVLHSGSKPCH